MVAVDNAGGSAGDSRTSTMHFVARYGWRFPIVYDPTNHLAVRYVKRNIEQDMRGAVITVEPFDREFHEGAPSRWRAS